MIKTFKISKKSFNLQNFELEIKKFTVENFFLNIEGKLQGYVGALFIKLNLVWCRFKNETSLINRFPITEVLLLTFLTAVISFPNEFTRLSGLELLRVLFDRCEPTDNSDLWSEKHFKFILKILMERKMTEEQKIALI